VEKEDWSVDLQTSWGEQEATQKFFGVEYMGEYHRSNMCDI